MTKTTTLTLDDVQALAEAVLKRAGMNDQGGKILANIVRLSERDGPRSHGLRMLPIYAKGFATGYANPTAAPTVTQIAPGVLRGDGDNGYFQIVAEIARDPLIALARERGIAAFTCANSHHLGAMRFDTEPLAEAGLVALGVVNSLSMVVPHGGNRPVYGTNPMSFACPRVGQAPIVWDQASSVIALMDIRMAAAEGDVLPRPGGLDETGAPTTDPDAILKTRSLLPFGEHKGSAIAFLIEVLGAALAGGTMSVDNAEREAHGALNVKGGATLIAIDPSKFGNAMFDSYITRLCAEFDDNGTARIPGDGRLSRRAAAETSGVQADSDLIAELKNLSG
ncbi:MAG: Ldh family oxidoreductase [Pseudoprimorskyibacter sp.]|nr:Ldh family oxidoreductase [Pseudoprimorskyibacter sp.]